MELNTEHPHLNKAPITEAIIEIRFKKVDTATFKSLEDISVDLASQYPKKEIKGERQITFDLQNKSGVPQIVDFGPSWILLKSNDDKKVVQLKPDRYSFSYVGNYPGWNEFSTEATKIWWTINKKIRFERVTRIGVRFVNNLGIPKQLNDLREYLNITPTVPPNMDVVISSFANKTGLINPKISAGATISVALNQVAPDLDNFPVMLDIDVFKNIDLPNETDQLTTSLQDLRIYKNQIFFNCLTPKAREFYNER